MSQFEEKSSRRDFLGNVVKVGVGAVAANALINTTVLAITDDKGKVVATVKLADYKGKLKEAGDNILIEDTPVGDILIIKLAGDKYSVMSNICPHKKCKVQVKSADLIQCPCHKSSYALDGTYRYGPSKKDLKRFPFEVKDGAIVVSSK